MKKKYCQTGTTVQIRTNHDGVKVTAIMLRSIAASLSWRSPVIAVKQASETKSATLLVNNEELVLIILSDALIRRPQSQFYGAVILRNLYVPLNSAFVS